MRSGFQQSRIPGETDPRIRDEIWRGRARKRWDRTGALNVKLGDRTPAIHGEAASVREEASPRTVRGSPGTVPAPSRPHHLGVAAVAGDHPFRLGLGAGGFRPDGPGRVGHHPDPGVARAHRGHGRRARRRGGRGLRGVAGTRHRPGLSGWHVPGDHHRPTPRTPVQLVRNPTRGTRTEPAAPGTDPAPRRPGSRARSGSRG